MGLFGRGHGREFGPFTALLGALVFFIALMPAVEATGVGGIVVRGGFTAILIAGLGIARGSRHLLAVAIVLLALNLVAQWLAHLLSGDESSQQLMRSAFAAIYLLYLVCALAGTLTRQRDASLDTVLGGINVYLLLAIAFMELHLFFEHLFPGSYVSGGLALSDPASHPHASLATTLLYFSFTTLTTLGYGDIAPARPMSQFLCSAEAVIGQLYVAIFIGGLVALRVTASQRVPPSSLE